MLGVEVEVYADLYSPFSNEKIAEIPQVSLAQVDDAIRNAVKNQHGISEMTSYERARILE